ncbi:MAG: pilus assembly protein, partial [Myxococcaceae bacterium]
LVANNDVSPAAAVFTTNWLRFHPPKWTLLSLAYKRLVNGPLLSVLREAVVATNGTTGGQVVQKMLPQSCNGTGRPLNQKQGAIDALTYTSPAKPLAEMLFNTGWYMGGQESPWLFTNAATRPGAVMANGRSGPCNGCAGDFIVLFSDGRSDVANPACTQVSGVTPAPCSAAAQCTTLGMGGEDDGDDFLDPAWAGGAGTVITGSTVRQMAAGTCDMDFSEDVARWMRANNMSTSAASTIRTYVVGIGDPRNTYGEMSALRAIAAAGDGQYVVADDFASLESNIEYVFTTIITRATSFAAAAITSVQTHGYTSAFIPRFRPDDGAQWYGSLSRLQLFNEFSAGCQTSDYGVKNTVNPNGDGSCNDVYLRDKNGAFVSENSNGDFVHLDSTATWDGGWPIKVVSGAETPAVPVWEASTVLTTRENAVIAGTSGNSPRKIYTVAPNGAGGYATSLVPFTVTNVAAVTPLLKLGGVSGDICTTLAGLTRHTYADENACAADVIRFMHGEDMLRQNPYNRTNPQPAALKARPQILGDIFHSTPVMVTPPVLSSLCDTGLVNQCTASLYSSRLTPNGSSAYKSYLATNQYRRQIVLVGSNDGMLHAFSAGDDQVTGTTHSYDLGSGEELWAFIPPDQLPKLIRYMIGERHSLLVDGTPMVRDIWVDGSDGSAPDHIKQATEFHTVAITGEREGGRHYFALDVTNPSSPRFLWEGPVGGTTESLQMGEAWNDLGPNSPPIGPIAEYDPAGAFTVAGQKARERYVVALSGGYDPARVRGRSIQFLDAWTGQPVYRFARSDATSATDPRMALAPVAAAVSLLDLDFDGLFDTGVVGDIDGQVWTLGMSTPGSDTGGDGLYDNWFGGRAFVQFKGQAIYKRSPFFQRVVAGVTTTGEVRIFLGAGDRAQIKDPNGGTCSLWNINACMRKNCAVSASTTRYRVGPGPSGAAGGHFITANWSVPTSGTAITYSMVTDSLSQSVDPSDVVDAQLDFSITCGATSQAYSSRAYCDWGASSGLECPVSDGRPLNTQVAFSPSVTMQKSRFYSLKLFDTTTRPAFTTAAGASTYDAAALTDSNLINASSATAGATSPGWFVEHANSVDERAASSALLLGGCVIWNTLQPNPVNTISCGGTLPLDTAFTYQAEATTGAIACGKAGSPTAAATARSVQRSTYSAPQQPSVVVAINPNTGLVSYSAVSLNPGAPPSATNVAGGDLLGALHWLEVPRSLHECRHNGNCN